MIIPAIARILGVFLIVFSFTLLPPFIMSFISEDGAIEAFSLAMSVTLITGIILYVPTRSAKRQLRTRDGFLVVVLFYLVMSFFGSLPFEYITAPNLSWTDAIFESVSGITTTGSTIMTHIDELPMSIIYYRSQLQLLGGMGIIVLAVAILPMLGVGGMALFRAEITGPVKDNKLTPRITETAKALWLIYVSLVVICIFLYWLFGMTLFDAVNYAFTTVATGGYAPHDASVGYYKQTSIILISITFMLLSSLNFALHFQLIKRFSIKHYLQDAEVRFFFYILLIVTALVMVAISMHRVFPDNFTALLQALFHVVSIITTTGFSATNYTDWPGYAPYMMIIVGLIGGCAGSTSGGVKVMRFLILLKQGGQEVKRLIHPNGQFLLKINQKTVPTSVVDSVVGFIAIYTLLFAVMIIAVVATHVDFTTAFSSVIACFANIGPGLEITAVHFAELSIVAKWILIFAMLLGRLEIFTFVVLLSPLFWRH